MLDCKHITQLISDSLDYEMTFLERVLIRFHILYCTACRRYRFQVHFLQRVMEEFVRRLTAGETGDLPTLSKAARQRIAKAIKR